MLDFVNMRFWPLMGSCSSLIAPTAHAPHTLVGGAARWPDQQ